MLAPPVQAPPAEQQAVDRGHLLSRTGSTAGDGSAVPSIASTPRHSTVHRLQDGVAVVRARSDPPGEAQLPAADREDRALALLSAPEQPDLQAYVDRKLANVNRILNGGEHIPTVPTMRPVNVFLATATLSTVPGLLLRHPLVVRLASLLGFGWIALVSINSHTSARPATMLMA